MTTHVRALLLAIALLLVAPAATLAGICYSVTGLPGPAGFDLVPLASSPEDPLPIIGAAHGVCGTGTPPVGLNGTVLGYPSGDARLGLRFFDSRPGCSDGEAEVVLAPPYESGTGQVRSSDGSVANVALTYDPTGASCQEASAPTPDPSNPPCLRGPTTLCLQGNRFRVTTTGFPNRPKAGQVLTSSSDTGFFYFVSSSNVDLTVKVLNACSTNNRFWVFAAASTNVEYTLTVTDTETNTTRSYYNPLRQPTAPIQDTNAFATCP